MNIENLLNTNWWFDYKDFYDFISSKNFEKLVEVGVWKGHSISYLASKNKNSKIWAVDLFEDTYRYKNNKKWKELNDQIPIIYEIYNENLKKHNVREIITDIKSYSWEGASLFENNSIDFCFIDADHSYDCVKKDITSWVPKIKENGIIAGHDYDFADVYKAVNEYFKINIKRFGSNVWYVQC